jgi:small subunit ribosomal protein S6
MRHYELMVILDPDTEERSVSPLIEGFLSVVREADGKVEKIDTWGRRRLSYEIKKKPEGIYSVIDLQATPEAVKELDRQMNLNESVLRTKVLRPSTR